MSHKFLFRFGYTWPEELEWCEKHPDADLGETSSAVLVATSSADTALKMGEEIAEVFIRRLYGARSYSWNELEFARWIEDDPEEIFAAEMYGVPVVHDLQTDSINAAVDTMIQRLEMN